MRGSFRKRLVWWIYQNDVELINNQGRRSQDYFIIQAMFGSAFAVLTGGQFLSGFAIYLGASDKLVGYIPIIGSICGIFLIFFSLLVENFHDKKKLVLVFNRIIKPLILSIIFIPLLIPSPYQAIVMFLVLIVAYMINSAMGLAVNSWFVNVISPEIRGRYYSIRQIYAVLVSVILPIVAGTILDSVSKAYTGFVILFSIAFIMFLGENYAFRNIQDGDIKNRGSGSSLRLRDVFLIPVKNKEFMEYTGMLAVFYVFLYISASFAQLYMLRYLGLSYTFISIMTTLNAVLQVLLYSRWGRVGDRLGQKFVIEVSICFYAIEMILWALVSRKTMYIFVPMVYVIAAISNSGFAVGAFNRRYDIIPREGRSLYDGFFAMTVGLVLLTAPWIGSKVRECLAGISFIQERMEFGNFRITFGISALGLIALQLYKLLRKDRKPGMLKAHFRNKKY